MITCKNCGNKFEGNFCNQCGQKARTDKINFKYVLNEVGASVLQVDRGIIFTIKELFTRPGHSIRAYLEGKRVNHYRAISFLLVTSTIYALVAYWLGEQTNLSEAIGGAISGITDKDKDQNLANSYFITLLKWLGAHPSYFALILFPFFSFASYIAFIKFGYNYFEHLILNAYLTGLQSIIYTFFIPITKIFGDTYLVGSTQLFLGTMATFWMYSQFFKDTSLWVKILLTILSYILYFLLISILMFVFFGINEILH